MRHTTAQRAAAALSHPAVTPKDLIYFRGIYFCSIYFCNNARMRS
jgi:hypothetical protein